MRKDALHNRLYFNPLYPELARMIGYSGILFTEAQEKVKEIAERFPKEKIQAAVEEISRFDTSTKPATIRLTDEAQRLCWQLLGPPTGHPMHESTEKKKSKPAKPDNHVEVAKKPSKPREKSR